MTKPSEEKNTITSESSSAAIASELTDQDLDEVAGGGGKAPSGITHDESPKETVTFEYGGLSIQYAQQKPD